MKHVFTSVLVAIILLVNIGNSIAITYYSKSGQTVPTNLSNWTTASNGSGANPANFTTANDLFVVQAGHSYTSTAAWILGTNVNLKVDGSLNASSQNLTVGGTTQISNGGLINDDNNSGTNTFSKLLTIDAGGSLVTANSSAFVFTGGITNNGTFNKSGTGNITFNATQSITTGASFTAFAGNATVTSGTLTITGSYDIPFAGTFNVNASQSLIVTNTGITTFTGLVTNSGTVNATALTSATNLVFNGGITNTGTFNVPYLTVSTTGNRTISSTTAINWSSNNIAITGSGTLTIAGAGLFTISGSAAITIPAALAVTGNLTLATTGAVSVVGATTISGTGNLTDNENTSTTTFTGLLTLTAGTIDLSALSTANVLINGGLTNTAGTFNIPNLTFNSTGNRTILTTPAINWSTNNISFVGTGTLTLTGNYTFSGTADLNFPTAVTIPASSSLTLTTSGITTLSSTSSITGSLFINGKTLVSLGNITVNSGGLLDIGAGGFLKMANTRTITNAGIFKAVGTLGNVATVTNNGSGNYTIVQSATTGVFHANYYLFDNLGLAGIAISTSTSGCIDATNNFSNGSFTNGLGGTNSTYLNLTNANLGAGLTINNISFGLGQVYNVTRTAGTGVVTFQDAQGAMGLGVAGQQFEKDNGVPGSLIQWNVSGNSYVSQGNGNFSDLSNWKDGSNNSPSAAKLTDASSVFVVSSGHTITVDQNLRVDSLRVNGTLIIGNDATSRTVITESDFVLPTGATVIAGSTAATHTFSVNGHFTNNGTVNFFPSATRLVDLALEGLNKNITINTNTNLYNVTINSRSFTSVSYTLMNDLVVNGTLTINSGATFNDGGKKIRVFGNWYQTSLTAFVATASGIVQFEGTNVQSIGGGAPYNVGVTFGNVSLLGSANTVIFSSASVVNGDFFATNAVTVVVSNINFTLNGKFQLDGGSTYSSALTTTFGSTSATQLIDLTNASFTNITFSGAGLKSTTGASGPITGLVNITNTATVDGASTLNIVGAIRVDGTCNLSGTINFTGTSNPTIYSSLSAYTLGTAAINCSGSIWLGFVAPATSSTLTIGGNITINNPNNIGNQYLVLRTGAFLSGNGSNTFSLNSNALLYVRGTNNFPTNFATYNIDLTSNTVYDLNADQVVRGGISYGNIVLRANSPSVVTSPVFKTADGDITIKGNLSLGGNNNANPLINDTITFNLANYNHYLAGRLYNIGTASTMATGGTFNLNADNASQQIDATSKNYNFYNFGIDQGTPTASRTKTIYSPINVAGSFKVYNTGGDANNTLVVNMGSNLINGSGGSSDFTLGSNVIFQTSAANFATAMSTFGGVKQLDATSTFNYNLAGNQDIASGFSYGNLLLSGSGNKTTTNSLDINGYLNASGTAILVDGIASLSHTIAGDLYIPSANYTAPTATITLDGLNQNVLLSGNTSNVYNLVVSGSGTKVQNGTLNVLNDFTINPNVNYDANTRALNIGGNLSIGSGVFTQTSGITTFNGNSSNIQNVTSNTNSYFGGFTINRQGANKTLKLFSDITVIGALTMEYDRLSSPVNGYADFNTNGFNITVGGNFVYYPLTTLTATGSTFYFNGANLQNIYFQGTGAFNNLEFSNAGVKRFYTNGLNSNNVLVAGFFNNNGSTVDNATNNVDMSVAGDWTNTGIFQGNGRTVTFNGANQNISTTSFGHVVISGTNKKTLTGAITMAGNLAISANDTLDVSANNYSVTVGGNWDMSATGATFIPQNGIVIFAGNNSTLYTGSTLAGSTATPSVSSVPAGKSFYNFTLNKATGQSLSLGTINSTYGDLKVANNLTITTGTLTTSVYDIFVGGNFVNNEVFNQNSTSSALTLNATSGTYSFDPGTNVSSVFRDLYLNAGTSSYTLLNNLSITNNNTGTTGLIATNGTFNLGGKVLKFLTSYTGTVLSLSTSNATLNADAGSYLSFANGNNLLNAGGNLKLIGTALNPVTITRSGTSGYTVTQTSGTLAAQYYAFQFLNNVTGDNGLTISGGTIDATNNLSNGTFTNGLSGSNQYLNLTGYAGDSIIASNVVFNAGPTKNVKFTSSSNANSKIILTSASGSLAGATYENDDASATTGKVKWRNTGIYWTGGAGATKNQWNNKLNWSTGNVPTAIDTVYLDHRVGAPSAAYTVKLDSGANANCYRLIIDKNGSANAIGLTLAATNTLTIKENVNVLDGCNITTTTASNQINVGGNWSFAATATYTGTAGTVSFNPTVGIKYVNAPTTNASSSAFYNFTVNAAAGATVMLGTPVFINNDVNLIGGTLDVSAGSFAMDVKGNWNVGTAGGFTPQTGTVTFSKTGTSTQTINAGPFYNFTSSAAAANATKQFTGNITILNTLTIGANTLINAGANDVYVYGGWANNSNATALTQTGSAAVNFSSTLAGQTIDNGSFATVFNNVVLQGAGTKTFANNSSVNGDFNISSSSGTVNLAIFNISGNGAANNFVISGATTLQVRGANNFPSGFEAISLASNSTVNYVSDIAQSILAVPSPGYGNLTIQKVTASGSSTKTALSSLILQSNLTVADVYSELNMSTNSADLTLAGNISFPAGGKQIVWGTGTSTLTQNGTATWDIDADITTFNNVVFSGTGTKRLNNNLALTGNLQVNSSVTFSMNNGSGAPFTLKNTGTGKTMIMSSGSALNSALLDTTTAFPTGFATYTLDPASTVVLNSGNGVNQLIKSDVVYGNLVLSNNTKNVTIKAGNNLVVKGTFTGTTNGSPSAAVTLIDNGQDITVGGDVLFGIFTPSSSARTLTLDGANQTLRHLYANSLSLGNVNFNGTGVKTFGDGSDAITVGGNLAIGAGVTVNTANNIAFSGTSWTNLGTWNHTNNTVTFNNTSPLVINPGATNTFSSASFTGTSSVTFTTNGATFTGGNFIINGTGLTLDMGALTHNIAGNVTLTSGTWTTNNASFNFNGGNQSIPAMTAKDVLLATNGTKTLNGAWAINNLTINNGVAFNTSTNNYNISVAGNWINNGSFNPNTSTVTFNATSASTLTINNNTSKFYIADFLPTAPVTYNLTAGTSFITLSSNIGANASLNLQGNTLVLGSATYSNKLFNVAGTLDVTPNGALKFDNTYTACTMNVTGKFKLVGSLASIASVTQYNTYNSYQNGHQININAGASLEARYYLIKDLADIGMYVDANATLDATNNFSDGTWSNIRTNTTVTRRYLQIDCPSPGTNISNVTFNYSGSPTPITSGAYNVKRSASAIGVITFVPAIGGNLGDYKFEDDGVASATLGKVVWPLATNVTWTGAVSTEWNDAANWTPNIIPDTTINATIPLVTKNPIIGTADAYCKNLIITNGQLTLQNAFTLNTKGDINIGMGTNVGVLTVMSASSTINCQGNWTRGANGVYAHGNGTVVFTGATGASTITPLSSPFYSVEFNNHTSVFYIVGNTVNFAGNFTIIDGQVFPNNANYNFNIAGNVNCEVGNGASFSTATIGTITLNGGNQSITDPTFYNLVVAGTGTKSTTGIITIIGTTTINSGTVFSANPYVSDVDFQGNVIINAGGTFADGGNVHTFSGASWTGTGTYTGTGTVSFVKQGAQTQTINNATFNNLTFATGGGTVVIAGAVSLTGDLTVASSNGGVNVNLGSTITSSNGVGTFTLVTGKTFTCYGLNSFPTNFANYDLQSTSTVYYYGTANQNVFGTNYFNLYLNNNNIKTLIGDVNVRGALQFNNASLDVSSNNYAINVQGSWNNTNIGTFIPRSGTVTFDGSTGNQSINIGASATNPFYNVNINNAGYTVNATLNTTIQNNLSVFNGTFSPNGNIVYVGKNLMAIAGTFANSGTYYLNNSGGGTIDILTNNSTLSNLTIDGAGSSFICNDNLTVAGNFKLLNGTFNGFNKVVNLGSNGHAIIINGTYQIGAGGVMAIGNLCTVSINGTLVAVGTPSNAAVITRNILGGMGSRYSGFQVNSGGTIQVQYYLIEYMGSGGILINSGATIDPANNFSNGTFTNGVSGGVFLDIENNQKLTGANKIVNASFAINPGGGAKNVAKTTLPGDTIEFYNASGVFATAAYENDPNGLIKWSGPVTLTWNGIVNTDWNTAGNWTANFGPNIVPSGVETVVIANTTNQPVISTSGALTANLTINSGATLTITTPDLTVLDLNVKGDITINGTLKMSTANDGIYVAGNWQKATSGTVAISAGTVTFTAAISKNINNGTGAFGTVVINSAASLALGANTSITKDLILSSGTLDVSSSNYQLTIGGSLLNTGSASFLARNGKVIFAASSGTKYVNVGSSPLFNVDFNPSAGVVYQLISGNLSTQGNVNLLAGTLNLNGLTFNMGDGVNSDFMAITGGTLVVGPGASLKMGNLSNIGVNTGGALKIVGSSSGFATMSAQSGTYGLTINSGGAIYAQKYRIENINANGVYVKSGATIDATNNFSDGTFAAGTTGGTYLQLENSFSNFTADSVEFNTGASFNCIRTTGSGVITFSDPTGTIGNFSFEKDDQSISALLGLVKWSYTTTTATWTGAVSNKWNNPLNWDIFSVPSTTVSAMIANVGIQPVIDSLAATANYVTILSGATLTVKNNLPLTIKNNLTNGGTLTVVSTLASDTSNIIVGASWLDNGTFNPGKSRVTLTSNSLGKNIATGATSQFYNLTLAGTATFSLNNAMTVANNIDIKTGSTLSTGSGNYGINLGGSFTNNGTFTPGSGTVTLTGTSGTQNITAGTATGKTFYNLTKASTSTSILNLKTDIGITNDLTINKGNVTANGYDFNVGGNYIWNNTGGSMTNADLVFTGGATKLFSNSSGTSGNTFNNVTFNKTAGTIILSNSITVNGTLTFNGGKMQLGARSLTIGASATIVGGSSTSYIQADNVGTVIKLLNNSNKGVSYTLPIGDASNYTPITFNLTSGTLASGANIAVNLRNVKDPNLPSTSHYLNRYWEIVPTGITTPVYNVAYNYVQSDVVGKDSKFTVGKYSTATAQNWNYGYMYGTWAVDTVANVLTWNGVTSFSRYTGLFFSAPLPVSFVSANAQLNNDVVTVSFVTAQEENNKYFVIERSADGVDFDSIGTIKGAGNSNNKIAYNFSTLYNQDLYYRIKQVDFDGKISYSYIFELNTNGVLSKPAFNIYPNPSAHHDEIFLAYNVGQLENTVTVTIYDLTEKVHYKADHDLNYKGLLKLPIVNKKEMPSGVYIVTVKTQDETYTFKLVIN